MPQTRTPDAHFYTETATRARKAWPICPDYSEASKFADLWISPKQGTDAALGMAMGHVILREFHIDRQAQVLRLRARLQRHAVVVRLVKSEGGYVPSGSCARPISLELLAKPTTPDEDRRV